MTGAPRDASSLPTGTITLLFTDIQGSTRLWEVAPAAMRQAIARHDAIVTETMESHNGVVVRHRGEGDSWFGVFARASDAVTAAAAIQRALAAERWPTPAPLKVRIAVHTGETELRDGDYYGPEVNRAARLRALADGGQTLVSEATANLVRRFLPRDLTLRPLGAHRLKDIQQPEHVFALHSTAGGGTLLQRALRAVAGLALSPHLKGAAVAGGLIVTLIFVVIIVTSSFEGVSPPPPPTPLPRPHAVLSASESVVVHPEGLQLRLTVANTVFPEGQPIRILIHIENTGPDVIRMSFPTEHFVDLIVEGVSGLHAGREVYRWSDGRPFGASRRIEQWNPREDRTFEVEWRPPRIDGSIAQTGAVYRLKAVLVTDKPIETSIDATIGTR